MKQFFSELYKKHVTVFKGQKVKDQGYKAEMVYHFTGKYFKLRVSHNWTNKYVTKLHSQMLHLFTGEYLLWHYEAASRNWTKKHVTRFRGQQVKGQGNKCQSIFSGKYCFYRIMKQSLRIG